MKDILIADDSATARMIVKRCLQIIGFQEANFIEFDNGKSVVDYLQENSVQLVVSDLNMPTMDGLEMLKNLKEKNSGQTPIVFVTSARNQENKKELLDNGAYAVIKKPVAPAELRQELQDLI